MPLYSFSKKGKTVFVNNCRPTSIFSTFSKIF
jgi:hypothetical protein